MWEYNYICHHGIKGQRWGIRRYQNEDGSLTDLGARRLKTLKDAEKSGEKAFTNVIYQSSSQYAINKAAKRDKRDIKTAGKQILKAAAISAATAITAKILTDLGNEGFNFVKKSATKTISELKNVNLPNGQDLVNILIAKKYGFY